MKQPHSKIFITDPISLRNSIERHIKTVPRSLGTYYPVKVSYIVVITIIATKQIYVIQSSTWVYNDYYISGICLSTLPILTHLILTTTLQNG